MLKLQADELGNREIDHRTEANSTLGKVDDQAGTMGEMQGVLFRNAYESAIYRYNQ